MNNYVSAENVLGRQRVGRLLSSSCWWF